jgi:hypothetical protein
MRSASIIFAFFAICLPSACEAACIPDQHGGLVCGVGKDAVRVLDDTTSPSKKLAIGWRCSAGLPADDKEPAGDVEDVIVRLEDGAVLGKLGGEYWNTGTMHPNRFDYVAAWSPDNRAVVEVANSRWDTNAFGYYAIDGGKVTKIDLLALASQAVKAKIPAREREGQAFRVREDLDVKLDANGRLRFKAMLYVPKGEASRDYSVEVAIASTRGPPSARIVSIQKIKIDE